MDVKKNLSVSLEFYIGILSIHFEELFRLPNIFPFVMPFLTHEVFPLSSSLGHHPRSIPYTVLGTAPSVIHFLSHIISPRFFPGLYTHHPSIAPMRAWFHNPLSLSPSSFISLRGLFWSLLSIWTICGYIVLLYCVSGFVDSVICWFLIC